MAKQRKAKKNSISDNHLELMDVPALTENQGRFFESCEQTEKSQVLLGYPGTGKTFIAMAKAFEDIMNPSNGFRRVVIVRSAVPTRDVGFLPGTLAEKGEVYELPYKAICSELFGRGDAYEVLKKHGTVEFMTTSFIRGITLDNCIIIADEFQNMTAHEADSILTRVGTDCKIMFCGDMLQRDITKYAEKTVEALLRVLDKMPGEFNFTRFTEDDIVRSGLVGEYIKAKHKLYPDGFPG
jgi:phosphate starvation-inducible protein PhoH